MSSPENAPEVRVTVSDLLRLEKVMGELSTQAVVTFLSEIREDGEPEDLQAYARNLARVRQEQYILAA